METSGLHVEGRLGLVDGGAGEAESSGLGLDTLGRENAHEMGPASSSPPIHALRAVRGWKDSGQWPLVPWTPWNSHSFPVSFTENQGGKKKAKEMAGKKKPSHNRERIFSESNSKMKSLPWLSEALCVLGLHFPDNFSP